MLEKRVFEDPAIPAFLESSPATKNKFKVTPRPDDTGKVVFEVQGEGIEEALQGLYANELVGSLDFIRALKGYRSAIFALKRQRNGVAAS